MKKPIEPQKPWMPYNPSNNTKASINLDQELEDDDCYDDYPNWPVITLKSFVTICENNNIKPESAEIVMHPGSHQYEMLLVGERTDEAKKNINKQYKLALKKYEDQLKEYQATKEKYDDDLRAYYKWKHDRV